MDDLQSFFAARAEAEYCVSQSHINLTESEVDLRRAGMLAFIKSLSARGIVEGGKIVIAGKYSGKWGGPFRDIKHGSEPVLFRSISVESTPATHPRESTTEKWWWFRVSIARLKKNGDPRAEYRNVMVHGDTPEAAALQIEAINGQL